MSAAVGLSFSDAPLHDVYLAQFPTSKFTLLFPAQCPRSAPTPEEMTAERVTDWTSNSKCIISVAVSPCWCYLCSTLHWKKKNHKSEQKAGCVFWGWALWHLITAFTLMVYVPPTAAHRLDRRIADLCWLLWVTASTGLQAWEVTKGHFKEDLTLKVNSYCES